MSVAMVLFGVLGVTVGAFLVPLLTVVLGHWLDRRYRDRPK